MVRQAYKENTRNTSVKSNKREYDKYMRIFLFVAVLVIVFYPPYLKGLFFESEQFPTEILVFLMFALFWVYRIIKMDKRFLETPLDYSSFALVAVYLLSLIVAVETRLAVSEWLKYCMYFAVFFMLSELSDSHRKKITVLWVITASAAGVSVLGIDGVCGGQISGALNRFFRLLGTQHDVFFDLFREGRIYSTLQYPNTLAAYLMAAFFIALGLAVLSRTIWQKAIASAAGFLFLVTFIFTLSRGAYVMMPVAAVVFLVSLPAAGRIKGIAFALPPMVSTLAASAALFRYFSSPDGHAKTIWAIVAIGVILSSVLTVLVDRIVDKLEKLNWKVYVGIASALLLIAAAGAIVALNSTVPLALVNSEGQQDGSNTLKKSEVLKPGTEYRLEYEVDASDGGERPDAYSIVVASRNTIEVIRERDKNILHHSGASTRGTEKRNLKFTVPPDSRIINIYFSNPHKGTTVIFNKAYIVELPSGKTVKNLKLDYKYIPKTIASRFEDIEATRSGVERGVFYKDGFSIFKDRWLIGGGGGAWQMLNFSYQSYLYWSTQAHAYFVQLAVETGIIGLLAFIALIASIAVMFIRTWKPANKGALEGHILQGVLFTAAAALVMHSFVDFDFSLSAVFLLFWEIAALFNAGYKELISVETGGMVSGTSFEGKDITDKSQKMPKKAGPAAKKGTRTKKAISVSFLPAACLVITLFLLAFPTMFLAAAGFGTIAIRELQKDNTDIAIEYLRRAISADPIRPEYRIDYANLLIRKKGITPEDVKAAHKSILRAEELCRYNARLLPKIAEYYYSTGNFNKSLEVFDRALMLRPFRPEDWQNKIGACYNISMTYFKKTDNTNGLKYLDMGLAEIEKARLTNEKNMDPFVFTGKTMEMLEKLKFIKDSVGKTKNIEVNKVVFYNMPEMDVNSDGIPDHWNAAGQGGVKLGYADGTVFTAENPSAGNTAFIRSRPLALEAGKTYIIEVEMEGDPGAEGIPFSIEGVTGSGQTLKPANGIYTAEVSTPQDFKPAENALVLGINGKYEIKRIAVMIK